VDRGKGVPKKREVERRFVSGRGECVKSDVGSPKKNKREIFLEIVKQASCELERTCM
jgi:hypothetical protein